MAALVLTTAALSLVGCAAVVTRAARIIRKDGHLLQHTALVVVLAAINFCEATCFALGRAFDQLLLCVACCVLGLAAGADELSTPRTPRGSTTFRKGGAKASA